MNRSKRHLVVAMAGLLWATTAPADGAVATFDSFTDGQTAVSFTDPHSGIRFRESTHPSGVFSFGEAASLFASTSSPPSAMAGEPAPGVDLALRPAVGFRADLPEPAAYIGLDAVVLRGRHPVTLRGYDAAGALVASATIQQPRADCPFVLEIDIPLPLIESFAVILAGTESAAYDNVRYAVPEPSAVALLVAGAAVLVAGRASAGA